jgi:hypothetical protein
MDVASERAGPVEEPRTGGSVERCSRRDADDVLRFRSRVHGPATVFADPQYYRWMYHDGAVARGDADPACWVYRHAGRVVGQIGAIPVALKAGDHVFDAMWGLDGAIDESLRGQGVLPALLGPFAEERDLAMATEVHPAGVRACLRAGWIELRTLPLFVRPIDLGAFLRAGRLRLFAGTFGRAANLALRAIERVQRSAVALEQVGRFDQRVDRVWDEASPSYPVICRRDLAFLEWRFGRYPAPRYRCYYLRRGPDVVGYAVVRAGRRGGLPASYLVDFLCEPRWLPGLLGAFVQLAVRDGAAIACCLHASPISTSAFIRAGFFERDTGWPLLVRLRSAPRSAAALVVDGKNWFVTAADSDLDRPRPQEEGPA